MMPFWVSDWLGSTRVAMMSPAERGAYIQLLARAWTLPEAVLPPEIDKLHRLADVPLDFDLSAVLACFDEVPGGIANRKQQVQWFDDMAFKKERSESGKRGAANRWGKGSANSSANDSAKGLPNSSGYGPSSSSSSSSSSLPSGNTENPTGSCPETSGDKPPKSAGPATKTPKKVSKSKYLNTGKVVGTFPVNANFDDDGNPLDWELRESLFAFFEKSYPELNVRAEMLKAKAWIETNHRKTPDGMPKFLNSWLTKACNNNLGRRRPLNGHSLDKILPPLE